jgi:hypothetical protein
MKISDFDAPRQGLSIEGLKIMIWRKNYESMSDNVSSISRDNVEIIGIFRSYFLTGKRIQDKAIQDKAIQDKAIQDTAMQDTAI